MTGPTARILAISTGLIAAGLLLLQLAGCQSATEDVATSLTKIQHHASTIDKHAADILLLSHEGEKVAHEYVQVPQLRERLTADQQAWTEFFLGQERAWKSVSDHAASIQAGVVAAQTEASTGLIRNTQTTDKTSPWLPILKWGLIAVGVGGLIYVLVATGALGWLRGMIGLVTPATRTKAKFLAEAIAQSPDDPALNAHVALERNDPAFNVQFQKAKAKVEEPKP